MNMKLRKADIVLIAFCLLLALGSLVSMFLLRESGARACVYVNGVRTAEYSLRENITVELRSPDGASYNTLVIADGCADVVDAGCPDKLCVNMHSIAYAGETITCLPNKTVIKIEGGAPQGVDVY